MTSDLKRRGDEQRVEQNRKLSRTIRKQIEHQIYNTNVKRVEDMVKFGKERYDSDLESLNNLSIFV